jgi:hypothetical protein
MADHSGHANKPFSCSVKAMANAWASHGARNTGPLASRGMPGTASAARRADSGSIEAPDMFDYQRYSDRVIGIKDQFVF